MSHLQDLADMCGRGFWKVERPEPASTHFIQRSRVENYRVVSTLIQEESDVLKDERTRNAVFASVCRAVDIHLGEPGCSGERDRTIAALSVAGFDGIDQEVVKFVNHRQEGGTRTWQEWIGQGGTDGR